MKALGILKIDKDSCEVLGDDKTIIAIYDEAIIKACECIMKEVKENNV